MIPVELLLHAYRHAVFPMAMENGEIAWFSPDPRAIIPLDTFHVPHGLKRTLKKTKFEIRIDTAFEAVMRACAQRDETWINDVIVASYVNLHREGHAHSVEAWLGEKLVGGLYGVSIGGAFFGESMFHRVTDASKIAMAHLVERLNAGGYRLLDTQFVTDHLKSLGGIEIPREIYEVQLADALTHKGDFFALERPTH